MKITKQDLVQLIKEELDIMLSEQPRPGGMAAQALQRRKDRASQGIPLSRTEKSVDTKLVGKGAGRPSGQSAAEQERRVAGAADTSGIRLGGAGMDSAAFTKPTKPTKPATAAPAKAGGDFGATPGGHKWSSQAGADAAKTAKPQQSRKEKRLAYGKTLARMKARGKTLKPSQISALKDSRYGQVKAAPASQTPAKPAAIAPASQTPAKPAAAKPVTDSGAGPMSNNQTKAQDDVLKNLTAQGALGGHLETIVNEILSRLNQ